MHTMVSKLGKRGTFVIPAELRAKFGLKEGDLMIAEEREDGLLLKPAIAVPVEEYNSERKAQFLLTNAVSADDYKQAKKAVRALGINPNTVKHVSPFKVK